MDLIHRIRTIAWYNEVSKLAGTQSAYALSKVIDDFRIAKRKSATTMEVEDFVEVKDFAPYSTGRVVPSEATLDMVEEQFNSSKEVYEIGPRLHHQDINEAGEKVHLTGCVPLWMVLAGSDQVVRNVLVRYDKKFAELQTYGVPFLELLNQVLDGWLPSEMVMVGYCADSKNPETNIVAIAYREYDFPLSMERYIAILALWRLSMINNDSWPLMEFLMAGLNQKAVPDLLTPFGIADSVQEYCKRMEAHHWNYLKRFMKEGPDDSISSSVRLVAEKQPKEKSQKEKSVTKSTKGKTGQDTAQAALQSIWGKVVKK